MTCRTLLCFDFGNKRIGTAVGQTITGTATPLEIIHCDNNQPDWKKIEQLIRDWQPDAIVVGVPLNMDGSIQEITDSAARFSRQLEGRFQLPVFGMDERLSTYEAKKRLGSTYDVDSVAAQAILETWLAENNDMLSQN